VSGYVVRGNEGRDLEGCKAALFSPSILHHLWPTPSFPFEHRKAAKAIPPRAERRERHKGGRERQPASLPPFFFLRSQRGCAIASHLPALQYLLHKLPTNAVEFGVSGALKASCIGLLRKARTNAKLVISVTAAGFNLSGRSNGEQAGSHVGVALGDAREFEGMCVHVYV
jgi:hypothetical protein